MAMTLKSHVNGLYITIVDIHWPSKEKARENKGEGEKEHERERERALYISKWPHSHRSTIMEVFICSQIDILLKIKGKKPQE